MKTLKLFLATFVLVLSLNIINASEPKRGMMTGYAADEIRSQINMSLNQSGITETGTVMVTFKIEDRSKVKVTGIKSENVKLSSEIKSHLESSKYNFFAEDGHYNVVIKYNDTRDHFVENDNYVRQAVADIVNTLDVRHSSYVDLKIMVNNENRIEILEAQSPYNHLSRSVKEHIENTPVELEENYKGVYTVRVQF